MSTAALIESESPRTGSVAPLKRLGRNANGMLMTAEEFNAVEDSDDRFRYELVHGVIVVSPPPGPGERNPNDELAFWLRLFQRSDARGSVIDATLPEQDIQTSTGVRRADRVIWVGLGRTPEPLRDVPAIAIEIVARRTRDRRRDFIEKRSEYAEAGVKEYWIVDRFRSQFVVCRGLEPELVLTAGVYQSPLLPGFELSVPALLAACRQFR